LFRPAALAPGSAAAAEGVGAGYAAQLLGVWLGTDHPRLPDGGVGHSRVRVMKMIKVRCLGTSSGLCARRPVRRRTAWLGHDLDMVLRLSCRAVRLPPPDGNGGPPMRAFVRAAFAAALVLLLSVPAVAAGKAYKRDDLADAAIKLEAQIKAEAGEVTKPIAALRREVDAAFQRGDDR